MAQIQIATEAELVGLRRTPLAVHAANYTIALADEGQLLHTGGSGGAFTYTLPDDASVPFPIGGFVDIYRNGNAANPLTVTAAAGVGLRFRGQNTIAGSFTLPYQYSVWRAVKLNASTWLLYDLTGDEDTGWLTLPLAAGFTGLNGTPQYRRIGRSVSLTGIVQTSPTGGTISLNTVVATLPAGSFSTTNYFRFSSPCNDGTSRRLNIDNTTGNVILNGGGTGTITWQATDCTFWL